VFLELDDLDSVARSAIYHAEEQVRLDALTLICEARRTSEAISQVELDLLVCFMRANMGVPGAHFRQDSSAAFSKLIRRLHDNATFCHSTASRQDPTPYQPGQKFMSWLIEHCLRSLYPGAPFARDASILNLLRLILEGFFHPTEPGQPHCDGCADMYKQITDRLFTADGVRPLLSLLLDSYDASRAAAARCLIRFPSPLPGYESKEAASQLLHWGLAAINDPKASQSDGGAAILLLVFQKYVHPLGWQFFDRAKHTAQENAEVAFLSYLIALLEDKIAKAKEDLAAASRHQPIHGLLRTLSYLYRDVMEQSANTRAETNLWEPMNCRVIQLIHDITELVVCALENPAPEGYVLGGETDVAWPSEETNVLRTNDHHYLLAYCWRGVKEAR
jgi:hypothetical protein